MKSFHYINISFDCKFNKKQLVFYKNFFMELRKEKEKKMTQNKSTFVHDIRGKKRLGTSLCLACWCGRSKNLFQYFCASVESPTLCHLSFSRKDRCLVLLPPPSLSVLNFNQDLIFWNASLIIHQEK